MGNSNKRSIEHTTIHSEKIKELIDILEEKHYNETDKISIKLAKAQLLLLQCKSRLLDLRNTNIPPIHPQLRNVHGDNENHEVFSSENGSEYANPTFDPDDSTSSDLMPNDSTSKDKTYYSGYGSDHSDHEIYGVFDPNDSTSSGLTPNDSTSSDLTSKDPPGNPLRHIGTRRDSFITSDYYINIIMGDKRRRTALMGILGTKGIHEHIVLTRGHAIRVADMLTLSGFADTLPNIVSMRGSKMKYVKNIWYNSKYNNKLYVVDDTPNKARYIHEKIHMDAEGTEKPNQIIVYIDDNVETYNAQNPRSNFHSISLQHDKFGIVGNDNAVAELNSIILNNTDNKKIVVVWDFDCTLSYNHMFKIEAISHSLYNTDAYTRYMEGARKYLLVNKSPPTQKWYTELSANLRTKFKSLITNTEKLKNDNGGNATKTALWKSKIGKLEKPVFVGILMDSISKYNRKYNI
jgi:hypothetical protein